MAKVYFTSDLHFDHANLCVGLRQIDVLESNKKIIHNWNSIVTKRDTVYVLGDITMENHRNIEYFIKQLKGRIIVVGGNHDTVKCCSEYQRLKIPVMGTLQYKGFLCTHVPVHPTQLVGFNGNIHGHIHLSGIIDGVGNYNPPQLEGKYYNVNTEFHQYKPVLFDEIKNYFLENYG